MRFTVSIAVHNQIEATVRCLLSILVRSELPQVEILVVDNGSTPEIEGLLREQRIPAAVLRSDVNLGFGKAHNLALPYAMGQYFVVLNNDVEVCMGWLDTMRQAFLRNPRLGICGVAGTSCQFDSNGVGQPGPRLDYIEGSCMMIPTWLARKHGLFDPAFRLGYCEDADLSLRIRAAGYDLEHVELSLKHSGGLTAKAMREEEHIDVDGFHAYNHHVLRQRLQRQVNRKLVVVKRSGAKGDVLLATPLLRALSRAGAKVCVETICGDVLENNPDVIGASGALSGVESIDLDLAYELKPGKHIVEAYAEAAGLTIEDPWPRIYPRAEDREKAARWMPNISPAKWAVIHPGTTAWLGRNWAQYNFEAVTLWLKENGWKVVLVGDHATPTISYTLDLRGATTPLLLAAVMERAKLFVGIDSFPMHVAQATHTPLVAIFGAIDPATRLLPVPFFKGVTAPLERCGCLGCHHILPAPRTTGGCFRDRQYCMSEVTVEMVMSAIQEVLERRKMFLETSKIRDRVIHYCEGVGIDIGCGRDKITEAAIGYDDDPWPEVDRIGDAQHLDYPDNHFPFVFSSHCLEDVLETEATLREWIRVLRPGGHLILHVPHPDYYKGVNLDHKYPGFRPADLEALMGLLGMKVVESYEDVGDDRYSTVMVARKP